MLQRIIDVWPDLLRRGGADQSDADDARDDREADDERAGQSLGVDEAQLLQDLSLIHI